MFEIPSSWLVLMAYTVQMGTSLAKLLYSCNKRKYYTAELGHNDNVYNDHGYIEFTAVMN
jgi:hypothetical protein